METETSETGRTFGSTGPLVRVKWLDAAAQVKIHVINGVNPVEHLAVCETVGELIIDDPKVLILCQHWSDTDGIDILAIPRDWVQEITVLEDIGKVINESEVDKCTIENLESQQESAVPTRPKKSRSIKLVGTE